MNAPVRHSHSHGQVHGQAQSSADSALVDFWNDILAPKLVTYRHILVGAGRQHSDQVIGSLGIRNGDRILDVGCGFGDTTITLANLAAPQGKAVGIDCCQAFLDHAWEQAELGWIPNVEFRRCDIETQRPDGAFDFVFARFGTQFFANPVTGLRTMRDCLRPGGTMAHMVWRARADNPWLTASRAVVEDILPKPGDDARTCGPGPFSMADQQTTRAQMQAAGFTDIAFRPVDAPVLVGRTLAEAIAFQLAIGPAGETFREAGAEGIARRDEVESALAKMFATVKRDAQGFWMNSASWLITARNPARS
jgi:ubiquinone/menaquinone biosynthesis C-methylase UbiE